MRKVGPIIIVAALLLSGCATPAGDAEPLPPAPPEQVESVDPAPEDPTTFAAEDLVTLCIQATRQYHADAGLELYAEEATVYPRPVDPPWLVYVPGSNSSGPVVASLCIIGGTPSAPEFAVAIATERLTQEEIDESVASNEPYEVDRHG